MSNKNKNKQTIVTESPIPAQTATAETPVINAEEGTDAVGEEPAKPETGLIITPQGEIETAKTDLPVLFVPENALAVVEFDNEQTTTADEQVEQVKAYVRGKICRAFGLTMVEHREVKAGGLKMNGNKTVLKLPAVNFHPNGTPLETPNEYFNRCKPVIGRWLNLSLFNANQINNVLLQQIG